MIVSWIALIAASLLPVAAGDPIQLHPDNPHYFLFRGKPVVLMGSTEHYGAVLNKAFDYVKYLDTLKKDGLNLTRTFSGAYREVPGDFKIAGNTLAPVPGQFICPWKRTSRPGESDGGGKFNLSQRDDDYYTRLRDFVSQAGKRNIIVEIVLFCPFYEDSMWNASPLNAKNNTNVTGTMPRTEVYTLKNPEMLIVQDDMVEQIVTELREFDNVYYEICNEPYFGGVTLDWQAHIAGTIARFDRVKGKHLIAQNIANGSAKVNPRNPFVSIFNFHYASPPDAVTVNFGLNSPIAFDETGFKGTEDFTYRAQAWEFFMAGGSVFDHLDYSFTVEHPDGTARVADPTPGGGSPALRKQLGVLKRFLEEMDFLAMGPDPEVVPPSKAGGPAVHVLSDQRRIYAAYVRGAAPDGLELKLPAGEYRIEWYNTYTGGIGKRDNLRHGGGILKLTPPPYEQDIALKLIVVKLQ